jgi:hypothetical protein
LVGAALKDLPYPFKGSGLPVFDGCAGFGRPASLVVMVKEPMRFGLLFDRSKFGRGAKAAACFLLTLLAYSSLLFFRGIELVFFRHLGDLIHGIIKTAIYPMKRDNVFVA